MTQCLPSYADDKVAFGVPGIAFGSKVKVKMIKSGCMTNNTNISCMFRCRLYIFSTLIAEYLQMSAMVVDY